MKYDSLQVKRTFESHLYNNGIMYDYTCNQYEHIFEIFANQYTWKKIAVMLKGQLSEYHNIKTRGPERVGGVKFILESVQEEQLKVLVNGRRSGKVSVRIMI